VESKKDRAALELFKAMCRREEWPPLFVVHDPREGYGIFPNSFPFHASLKCML